MIKRSRQPDLFSHCVAIHGTRLAFRKQHVFEKNYRLQDIQLSKNRRRARALPAWESPRIAFPPQSHGGEYRARTGDLLVANQALSQLS